MRFKFEIEKSQSQNSDVYLPMYRTVQYLIGTIILIQVHNICGIHSIYGTKTMSGILSYRNDIVELWQIWRRIRYLPKIKAAPKAKGTQATKQSTLNCSNLLHYHHQLWKSPSLLSHPSRRWRPMLSVRVLFPYSLRRCRGRGASRHIINPWHYLYHIALFACTCIVYLDMIRCIVWSFSNHTHV